MIGPGEHVGEFALLDDSPRSATVQAKTDVLLLKLHRDAFHQVMATSAEAAGTLLRQLVQTIRENTQDRIALLEKQLREHKKFQSLIENASDTITVLDADGIVTYTQRRLKLRFFSATAPWHALSLHLAKSAVSGHAQYINSCPFSP